MNSSKAKTPGISGGQAACAVLIYRIFTLMTFVPLISEGCSFTVQTAAAAASAVIQCVLIIPAVILSKKQRGIFSMPKFAKTTVYTVYWVYFTAVSAGAVIRFSRFMDCRFGERLHPALLALMLAAVCTYCACCGIEGTVRAAAVILIFFAAMAVSVLIGSVGEMSAENISKDFSAELFLRGTLEETARSSELTMLCYLNKFTSSDYGKNAFRAIAGKFAVTVAVTSAVLLALGDYAYISSYPFLDLGSAAGVRFLQRIDAVYMMLWTITAVISLSAQIYLAGDCVSSVTGCGRTAGNLISSAAVTAASCILIYKKINADGFFRAVSSLPAQIVTAALIPLMTLIVLNIRSKRKEHPVYT